MIRFYAPDILTIGLLPQGESGHAIRVLRKRVGDAIEVVDGAGHLYRCTIIGDSAKGAAVEVNETVELPKVWAPRITLAVAPTKHNDRMEWLVEKLVEIGIDRIVPLRCRHSERKEMNRERMEKIAVSAMKQSLKALLPVIDDTTSFGQFMKEMAADTAQKFVGYCDADTPRCLLAKAYTPGADAVIMIGPEGDFAPEEIADARAAGFVPVTMGDNRLRTETAALVGVDTIHILNQANS